MNKFDDMINNILANKITNAKNKIKSKYSKIKFKAKKKKEDSKPKENDISPALKGGINKDIADNSSPLSVDA